MTILTSQKRTCYDRITTTNNNEEILIGLSGWMRRMLLEATITIAMIRGRKGTATGTITTTNHQHYQKKLGWDGGASNVGCTILHQLEFSK